MDYAMVNNNTIIDLLRNQSEVPQWPPALDGSLVYAVEVDNVEELRIGMLYNPDTNKFEDEVKDPHETELDIILRLMYKNGNSLATSVKDQTVLELMKEGLI